MDANIAHEADSILQHKGLRIKCEIVVV